MSNELTFEELSSIFDKALTSATRAARHYHEVINEGEDRGCCGFARVEIEEYKGKKIRGNTKVGKLLKEYGLSQRSDKVFYFPIGAFSLPTQSLEVKEAGAAEFARVLKENGFAAYDYSVMD